MNKIYCTLLLMVCLSYFSCLSQNTGYIINSKGETIKIRKASMVSQYVNYEDSNGKKKRITYKKVKYMEFAGRHFFLGERFFLQEVYMYNDKYILSGCFILDSYRYFLYDRDFNLLEKFMPKDLVTGKPGKPNATVSDALLKYFDVKECGILDKLNENAKVPGYSIRNPAFLFSDVIEFPCGTTTKLSFERFKK